MVWLRILRAVRAPFERRKRISPPPPSPQTAPDLGTLLPLCSVFADPDFRFGHWQGGEARDGVVEMAWFAFSPEADALIAAAYRGHWVRPEIDWATWGRGPECARLRSDPAALASASASELAHLLTLLVRGDRFNEGFLNAAFEEGLLHRILARVEALARAR
ncbi:DUF6508 domain-containing protein [Aureimonas sp. ME7]|uniref:DUF6508 domain-containing protein n=1 Tax=Aureimonas sp. ME7 TaxID=2744252 RepID=UPI0015F62E59|nr:DUF6508 domain-containing protein [Aureimonas sp. ME7]